jgi:hypothetical protein
MLAENLQGQTVELYGNNFIKKLTRTYTEVGPDETPVEFTSEIEYFVE